MSQARKIGYMDKALTISLNDRWEVAYGKIADLFDMKTGEHQKLVVKKE